MARSEKASWRRVLTLATSMNAGCSPRDKQLAEMSHEMMELAADMLDQLGEGVHTNPRTRRNPPLVIWGNPGAKLAVYTDQELSERAYKLSYRHVDDDQDYEHKFAKGVSVETCLIGDRATVRNQVHGVLLYRPDGRNLWDDYEV